MAKMDIVAKAFGLDLEEEFFLVAGGVKEHRCRLTADRLERMINGKWSVMSGLLEDMMLGVYTVEQVEWKPKVGESFWTYWGKNWFVRQYKHKGTFESEIRVASSVVFRTREEAYEARPIAYELITGKKWEGEEDVAKVG